jgi:hypothetical protein
MRPNWIERLFCAVFGHVPDVNSKGAHTWLSTRPSI